MGCCGAGLGPSLRLWVESTQLRHKSEDTMGRPQNGREEGERDSVNKIILQIQILLDRATFHGAMDDWAYQELTTSR